MKQTSADVLRQSGIVEEERAWHHQPRGTRSVEGAISSHVGVFGQGSCGKKSMYLPNSRDQVWRRDTGAPPLRCQDGGYKGNRDYNNDAVDSLTPLDVSKATLNQSFAARN